MIVKVKQYDTFRAFTDVLTIGGSPLDLTGAATVHFVLDLPTGVVDRVGTVVSATKGEVSYTPVAGDVATVGTFYQSWKVTWAGSRGTVPTDGFNVIEVQRALS